MERRAGRLRFCCVGFSFNSNNFDSFCATVLLNRDSKQAAQSEISMLRCSLRTGSDVSQDQIPY